MVGQFKGNNNGDLTAAWATVSKRGWKLRTTLWRCKRELVDAGFVYVTRQGRMPNTFELVALTWFPLDVPTKFDAGALTRFKPRAYVSAAPLVMPTIKPKPYWTLPNGGRPIRENVLLSPPVE